MKYVGLMVSGFLVWISSRVTLSKNQRWSECNEAVRGIGEVADQIAACSSHLNPAGGWWVLLVTSFVAAIVCLVLILVIYQTQKQRKKSALTV